MNYHYVFFNWGKYSLSRNIYRADKKYRSLAQLSKPNRERFSAQRLQLPAEPPGFSFNQVQTNWDSCTKKAVGRSVRQKAPKHTNRLGNNINKSNRRHQHQEATHE